MAVCYDRIIVMGSAHIAISCLKKFSADPRFAGKLSHFSYRPFTTYTGEIICKKEGIPFFSTEDRTAMTESLSLVDERCLIISAGNRYLFPRNVLEKNNLCVINFHDALLPKYPGQNAPTWAIYHGEKETGITWHMVDEGIDSGDICIQKRIQIYDRTTALEILKKGMQKSFEAFKEIYEDMVCGMLKATPQTKCNDRRIYKFAELPDDGIIYADNDPLYSYKVLRSMDYGRFSFIPHTKVLFKKKLYEVTKYELCHEESIKDGVCFDSNINQLQINRNENRLILTLGDADFKS